MWYTGPIDILIHSDILFQDWKVLQDYIIYCMKYSPYLFTSDVLESPYAIIHFYVAVCLSSLLVFNLWYDGMRVIHHDVRVFVI